MKRLYHWHSELPSVKNRTIPLVLLSLIFAPCCFGGSLLAIFPCRKLAISEKTDISKSKSGARAFLEATARVIATGATPEGDPTHKCRTDWKLHIALPGESAFREFVVYTY